MTLFEKTGADAYWKFDGTYGSLLFQKVMEAEDPQHLEIGMMRYNTFDPKGRNI